MKPTAVILSCLGGEMSALGVVRSLGRQGVPITLISEGHNPELESSRYIQKVVVEPEYLSDPDKGIELLRDLARQESSMPVIFPTADPDTLFLGRYLDKLEDCYKVISPPHELVEMLLDKGEFYEVAKQHDFPIPRTEEPQNLTDIKSIAGNLSYPVAMKPKFTSSWGNEEIQKIVDHKKAIRIDTPEQLVDYYSRLSAYNSELIIQEFVMGEDDAHWECHVFFDKQSRLVACLSGQKVRLYPTFCGGGCYVESIIEPELHKISREILEKIQYKGLANVDFKQDSRTGEFKLFEVNPRVSHWSILDAACGMNQSYMAYSEACGIKFDRDAEQIGNVRYFFFEQDIRSFIDYYKHGKWGLMGFLATHLWGKRVYQVFALDDIGPAFAVFKRIVRSIFKKIF